ncbi:tumor necrosis factor receptor superfamily member 11B-like [Carassius gibelio]|uniref:tumor necrosis factor receptor superfamily member 11B-like n=1 Tax=Carassius gibelio TaxID=101364 RepID=UPI002278EE7E|nr:tumor necrosis factor receptor superfamily member 11B-like [Carassius gibelio]
MFIFTVVLLPVLSGAGLAADEPTYRRTDPATRQQLRCKRCPPGTRLGAHCTSSSETDCVPCGPGMFTEFWNYIPECLRCDACSDHQRVVRPCNGTVNTVCECDAGFYWNQRFCRRHSECKPGHRLKASGTPHRDRVCELCAGGHFADVRKTHATCITHSACKTNEQLVLPGSRWHDNVCATCEQLTLKELLDLFEPVLSGLQIQYGSTIERLSKLVNRCLHWKKFGKQAALQSVDGPVSWLQLWSDETSEEALMNLPSIYPSYLLADKIAHKILQFQHHCHSTELLTF